MSSAPIAACPLCVCPLKVFLKIYSDDDAQDMSDFDMLESSRIMVDNFGLYVKDLHANGNWGFRDQFHVSELCHTHTSTLYKIGIFISPLSLVCSICLSSLFSFLFSLSSFPNVFSSFLTLVFVLSLFLRLFLL